MPDNSQPNLLILAGDDRFAMQCEIEQMRASLIASAGDPAIADLNFSRIDGRAFSEDALRNATGVIPFLTNRRLVVVYDPPLSRYNTPEGKERLKSLLAGLPPTTTLVLAVEDSIERRDWKIIPEKGWLAQWVSQEAPQKLSGAVLRRMQLPSLYEMPNWIRQEARRQGGQIAADAAQELASHTGNQTQLASQEITKLLTYVDYRRQVEVDDVEELVVSGGVADIFQMVEAAAQGNASQALRHLHRLLEEQDPAYIFTMLVRQFRLLLLARECLDQRLSQPDQVARELRQPRFVVERLIDQCRRFNTPQLEAIYRRLLAIDEENKTSQSPLVLALDTFIASLSR